MFLAKDASDLVWIFPHCELQDTDDSLSTLQALFTMYVFLQGLFSLTVVQNFNTSCKFRLWNSCTQFYWLHNVQAQICTGEVWRGQYLPTLPLCELFLLIQNQSITDLNFKAGSHVSMTLPPVMLHPLSFIMLTCLIWSTHSAFRAFSTNSNTKTTKTRMRLKQRVALHMYCRYTAAGVYKPSHAEGWLPSLQCW